MKTARPQTICEHALKVFRAADRFAKEADKRFPAGSTVRFTMPGGTGPLSGTVREEQPGNLSRVLDGVAVEVSQEVYDQLREYMQFARGETLIAIIDWHLILED